MKIATALIGHGPVLVPAQPEPVLTANSEPSKPKLDSVEISEAAQQRINQLQQGNEALEQAVKESRFSIRNAASERVRAAKEYLKILASMSAPDDRGAASEAVRMAREVKNAAVEFRGSFAAGEEKDAGSELAGFAGVAGDTLKLANGLVERYLQRQKAAAGEGNYLRKEISSALSVVRELINSSLFTA